MIMSSTCAMNDNVLCSVSFVNVCVQTKTTFMALGSGEIHLCGLRSVIHAYNYLVVLMCYCQARTFLCIACGESGICQIDTAPQSIEAIFTGRHETFQYTKVMIS